MYKNMLNSHLNTGSDENRAGLKPTLHDQSHDGDVTISWFPIATDRTICRHRSIIESGSYPKVFYDADRPLLLLWCSVSLLID